MIVRNCGAAAVVILSANLLAHAQAPAKTSPPAYYIAHFEPKERDAIKPYSSQVAATFEPFGGRFVVRGGQIASLEGDPPKGHMVMIAFPSLEKAQAWFTSPAYAQIKPIRHRAGSTRAYIVEAVASDTK
jgi:uncharacterized protein (DUF1330 family)